jgi:hypothetical protein
LVRSHHEVAALTSQQHQHTAGCLLIATKTPLLSAPAPLNDGPRASGASYAESRENTASCSYPGAAAPNHSLTRDTRAAHHSASAVFQIRENASGSPFWLSHPSRLTHSSTARTPSSTTATGTKNARRCARGAIDAKVPRSSRRIDGPPRHQPKRRLPAPKPFARLATGAHSLPLLLRRRHSTRTSTTFRRNRLALTPPRILVLLRGGYLDERTSASNHSPNTLDHNGRAHRAGPSLTHFRKRTSRSRPTRRNDVVGSHRHTTGDDPSLLPTPTRAAILRIRSGEVPRPLFQDTTIR